MRSKFRKRCFRAKKSSFECLGGDLNFKNAITYWTGKWVGHLKNFSLYFMRFNITQSIQWQIYCIISSINWESIVDAWVQVLPLAAFFSWINCCLRTFSFVCVVSLITSFTPKNVARESTDWPPDCFAYAFWGSLCGLSPVLAIMASAIEVCVNLVNFSMRNLDVSPIASRWEGA